LQRPNSKKKNKIGKQRPLYKLEFSVFKVDESDSLQDSFEFDGLA